MVCLFKREIILVSRQVKFQIKYCKVLLLQLSFLSEGTGRGFGVIIFQTIGQINVGDHTKNYVTKGDYYSCTERYSG